MRGVLILVLLFLSFSLVYAGSNCYTVEIQGVSTQICEVDRSPWDSQNWGDNSVNPQMPTTPIGSLNSFNGNLVLSETDLSLDGRQLDFSVTRSYNSNIHDVSSDQVGNGRKLSLTKPSWLGYGWDFNLGRIRLIDYPNPTDPNKVVSTENIVEFPDGSISRFIIDTQNNYNEKNYLLDNLAKVNVYHANLNYPVGYYEVIGRDGTKYIFNHWVSLGYNSLSGTYSTKDPITNDNNLWTDINSAKQQHQYVGIYLTRIEDKYGNYINVEYYDQKWRNPNDDTLVNIGGQNLKRAQAFGYNDAAHPVSYGSPFIKQIVDTNGREINFQVSNYQSINAKLDYIDYINANDKKIKINYIYSGELTQNPYSNSCSCSSISNQDERNICLDVCYGDSLLVEVKYEDEQGNLLYPSTKYTYQSNSGARDIFKLTKVDSPNLGITEYTYGDVGLCTNGYTRFLNVLKEYRVKKDPSDIGLFYQYDYFQPVSCQDWMRSTVLIGPTDSDGQRSVIKDDYILQLDVSSSSYYGLDWRSGLKYQSSIHKATGYDFITHKPTYNLQGQPSSSGWQDTTLQKESYFYSPIKIGKRTSINYNNGVWGFLSPDWYIPVKQGVLKEVYGEEGPKKSYFTEYKNIDKYGQVKEIINYGEVTSVSKTYDDPLMTSDLSGTLNIVDTLNDKTRTEVKYLYEDDSYYDNSLYSDFQLLDAVAEQKVYDNSNNLISKTNYKYDTGGSSITAYYTDKVYGKDNYVSHVNPYYKPLKIGNLNEVEVWENSDNKILTSKTYYDDAGNVIRTEDSNGNPTYFYFDILSSRDYALDLGILTGAIDTCNDGIDNDGDGCIDLVEEDNNDPCTLYPVGDSRRHEGVIHTYGTEKRISSQCDFVAEGAGWAILDPVCNSYNVNKCSNPPNVPLQYSAPGDSGTEKGPWVEDKFGFLSKVENYVDARSLSKQYEYYLTTGQVKKEIDNTLSSSTSVVKEYVYDDLGRIKEVYENGDLPGYPTKKIIYDDNYPRKETVYMKKDSQTYYNPLVTYYDKLSRPYKTEQLDTDGQLIYTDITYNAQGKQQKISRPYKQGEQQLYTEYKKYDSLARVTQVSVPNVPKDLKNIYGSNFVKQIDAKDKILKTENDAYGRTTKITQALGTPEESITINEYDSLGNLKKVTNPKGQILNYNFNSLGWLLNKNDPNSGTTTNEYDDNGNVIKTTFSNGDYNEYTYDSLNRVIKVKDNLGNIVRYSYLSGGKVLDKVTYVYDESGILTLIYDERGRLSKEVFKPICGCTAGCVDLNSDGLVNSNDNFDTATSDNKDFNGDDFISGYDKTCFDALYLEYSGKSLNCPLEENRCSTKEITREYYYDYSGNLIRTEDNKNNVYEYEYDNLGRLIEVKYNSEIISEGYTYNPSGSIESFDLGNGIHNEYTYYERGSDLVKSQITQDGSSTLFRRDYNYDDSNNLIEEYLSPSGTPVRYTYDNLYRLIGATDSSTDNLYPVITNLAYTYDKIGNRLTQNFDSSVEQYTYQQGNSKLTSVNHIDGSTTTYQYDPRGNLISQTHSGEITSYEYDSNNMLRKVQFTGGLNNGQCLRYYYDSKGNRIRKEDGTKDVITSYLYDSSGKLQSELNWHGNVACNAICGNGFVEEEEVCDFNAYSELECSSFNAPNGQPFEYGNVKCNSQCTGYDYSSCGYCGDNLVQPAYEQCDGTSFNTYSGIINTQGTALQCSAYSPLFDDLPGGVDVVSCDLSCGINIGTCGCYDEDENILSTGNCIKQAKPLPKPYEEDNNNNFD